MEKLKRRMIRAFVATIALLAVGLMIACQGPAGPAGAAGAAGAAGGKARSGYFDGRSWWLDGRRRPAKHGRRPCKAAVRYLVAQNFARAPEEDLHQRRQSHVDENATPWRGADR